MANRRAFKADESFLEKISMGAAGTQRALQHLTEAGHTPLELERGSTSFKIWKNIKIKRIRVPDILCIMCGRRVESRAKTRFEISMSHSLSDPDRAWDYGLEDDDFVALVICRRVGDAPIDWRGDTPVQYVSVRELRLAESSNRVKWVQPKGAEEGFERRITWPAAVAHSAGRITEVTPERIQYRRDKDGRSITLRLRKQGLRLRPLISADEAVVENQVLASVVPVVQRFACDAKASEKEYIESLSSPSLSERYAASRALSHFKSPAAIEALAAKTGDRKEHIYVRLEAAASLAHHGDERGMAFIRRCLADRYLENRLEAVIVLGEVGSDACCRLLVDTLRDDGQHPEIRAGSAWALGELRSRDALGALIASFVGVDEVIRVEAARALARLGTRFASDIIAELPRAEPAKRPGIAWALSRSSRFTIDELLPTLIDEDARRWVAYIIGTQDQERYIHEIESLRLRDPQVYFAVTVLWQIMTSWIYGLEEY